jgi:hypothetical protein
MSQNPSALLGQNPLAEPHVPLHRGPVARHLPSRRRCGALYPGFAVIGLERALGVDRIKLAAARRPPRVVI